MKKTAAQWFAEYGVSHQHPRNKQIHWLMVPAIYFSVVAALVAIPSPLWLASWGLHWGWLLAVPTGLFYLKLGRRLAVLLALYTLCCLALASYIQTWQWSLALVALVVFVVAWLGQFYGHYVEGKKPSFLQDLQFLLIGPAWLAQQLLDKWDQRQ